MTHCFRKLLEATSNKPPLPFFRALGVLVPYRGGVLEMIQRVSRILPDLHWLGISETKPHSGMCILKSAVQQLLENLLNSACLHAYTREAALYLHSPSHHPSAGELTGGIGRRQTPLRCLPREMFTESGRVPIHSHKPGIEEFPTGRGRARNKHCRSLRVCKCCIQSLLPSFL